MNTPLPFPPRSGDESEFAMWFERLWRYARPECSTSGDADATIPTGSTYHGVTALTAGRTLTLPPADDYAEGMALVIQDESGDAGTHDITIQRAGTNTVNGGTSVTISTDHGRKVLYRRGAGTWWAA